MRNRLGAFVRYNKWCVSFHPRGEPRSHWVLPWQKWEQRDCRVDCQRAGSHGLRVVSGSEVVAWCPGNDSAQSHFCGAAPISCGKDFSATCVVLAWVFLFASVVDSVSVPFKM